MEVLLTRSTFETLPDEILLEVCRYLLCSDVLCSFFGLNCRLTQMIARYRQHVILKRTSLARFDHLCTNVFPIMGAQIQSLTIDCCHSLLQDLLLVQHFAKNMSSVFPNLRTVYLISFKYQPTIALLRSLHGLQHLHELQLHDLYVTDELDRASVTQAILQANDNRLTRILLDQRSCRLVFDGTNRYYNIRELHINLRILDELPALCEAVPNVQQLSVTIEQQQQSLLPFSDRASDRPLVHLTHFQLVCRVHYWTWEALQTLLARTPALEHLSLQIAGCEQQIVTGDTVLALVPRSVRQFHYAVLCYYEGLASEVDDIIASWPAAHPVICFSGADFLSLHTVPWNSVYMNYSKFTICKTSPGVHESADCYNRVEQLNMCVDGTFTLTKALATIPLFRRVRDAILEIEQKTATVQELPQAIPRVPHLAELCLFGILPSDLRHLSLILSAAPNLSFLDLPFEFLTCLMNDEQAAELLSERIISLSIRENPAHSSSALFSSNHIPIIASAFPRIKDLYIALQVDDMEIADEDSQSSSSVDEMETSSSNDPRVPQLLSEFKNHHLVSLSISGALHEELKGEPERWLRENTILDKQEFRARFFTELDRLDIWM